MNAITFYRVGHWLYCHHVPVLPRIVYLLMFVLFNSSIPPRCRIGRGSRFAYGGIGVVIHGDCTIGRRVMIGQNVTIGGNFGLGVPTIGDNVYIAPGARILGEIHVGDNVIIGANAVVLHDVPSNSVVAGVPARVLRSLEEGSLDALAGRSVPSGVG